MKSVCQRVYRLGLSHYNIPKVTSSCAAFMEMLGWDSAPFRTDIVLLNLLLQYDAQAGNTHISMIVIYVCIVRIRMCRLTMKFLLKFFQKVNKRRTHLFCTEEY